MDRLEWSESCSLGIAEIDEQHRQIFRMINRLIDEKEATVRSETIGDLLTEMTAYAQKHLRYEESLLEELGYPDLEPHKRHHRAYRKKTVEFCTATTLGVESVPEALLEYLRAWWLHHILQDDRAYVPFVQAGSATTRADGPSGPNLARS
ncbi:MAG: bacteriohemerythrin [Candidatus Eisenbacteria bacterium]